jgi:Flp pilus assembly protein TadD
MKSNLSYIALCLLLLAGCSSMQKKDAAQPAPTQELPPMVDLNLDDDASSHQQAAVLKEPLVETTKKSSVDAKYVPLSQAVRSGKVNAIFEEAGKILSTNGSDPVALNTLALYHLRRGQVGAAKLLLGRAFEKNQASAALYNNFGVALLEEGDTAGAIVNFKKALRIDDNHVEALGNLGSIYVRGGDYAKAMPLLEQAYKANRGHSGFGPNYAIALRSTKEYDKAAKVYDEVLARNSRDVTTLIDYAVLLIEYMNKPKDGLALVYKVKFLETDKKDILARANALEKKAKAGLK